MIYFIDIIIIIVIIIVFFFLILICRSAGADGPTEGDENVLISGVGQHLPPNFLLPHPTTITVISAIVINH